MIEINDTPRTHHVEVVFEMPEMTGSPDESAEVLLDLYVADEVTIVSCRAYEEESANV